MFYNISRTLEIIPYFSWGILTVVLIFLEVKNFREQLSDGLSAEPGRGGFVLPPGDGYEYYVSANSIVYILQKAKNRFRIYVVQGAYPNTKMKRDKYGAYFNVRCHDTGTAEKIVDTAFGM